MSTPLAESRTAPEKKSIRTLALVSVSHALSHAYSALMPIVYPPVMQELGFGYAQLGIMVGVGNTFMSVLQGIFAFLMHTVRRRVLLTLGNVLLALSCALMPFAGGFAAFFLLNVLARISNSPQHPVGNSLVAENFGRKMRGTAFAINFAGGNAGTLLVPALGTAGVALLGWRATLGIFSVVALIVGLSSLAIPERPLSRPNPGGNTDGGSVRDEGNALGKAGKSWVSTLKDRSVRPVVTAAVVAAGGRGIGVVMVYVPLYLQQGLHLSSVNYATLFTIMMVGSVAGPVLVGRISDSVGRKRMALTTYVLAAAATFSLLLAGGNMSYLVPAMSFLGLVVYSQGAQIQALLADVTTKETRDMAYSVFFTISYLAGAVWSVILGAVIDSLGFTAAFVLMALSYFAGAAALIPAKTR
ncbi:MFS transporter [Paradesulfitobacterium ferrireducens]|uniref:MFS transporter n=1 Tax=Paradesulfitobacterium ferrireducens TaxID=2816476 RepID=UPI001A8C2827|nr:MFS transporter [Paradesulfitobacterium ferrireducens]